MALQFFNIYGYGFTTSLRIFRVTARRHLQNEIPNAEHISRVIGRIAYTYWSAFWQQNPKDRYWSRFKKWPPSAWRVERCRFRYNNRTAVILFIKCPIMIPTPRLNDIDMYLRTDMKWVKTDSKFNWLILFSPVSEINWICIDCVYSTNITYKRSDCAVTCEWQRSLIYRIHT